MKITFNKFGVCLAFFMITAYAFYVIKAGACPPDSLTYCFYGSWGLELVLLMRIHKNADDKKGESIVDKAKHFINEDNVEAIAEKKLGVDLKRSK